MKKISLGLVVLIVLTFCSTRTENHDEESVKHSILGIWTDGSGPNASIKIEKDSIYDVERFVSMKYELVGDSLFIYYEGEPFKAKINKIDADSLIYVSTYGETRMWRFKD